MTSFERVGDYELLRELGRGGMGTVHLARHVNLDRRVALKQFARPYAADPGFAARFRREARRAASLSHPHIVAVHEHFEHDGVPCIAMDYLPNGSLRPRMRSLTLAQVAGVLEDLLSALAHAHSRGVVHRDLKPENLLVTAANRVAIADFEIAKALVTATLPSGGPAGGSPFGTPLYMAPEQALGSIEDARTDLYAVGVIAYELLVGRMPFEATDTPAALLFRHVHVPVPPPLEIRPDLDPRLAAWLERMLAKDPNGRPPSAETAWQELEPILATLLDPRWRRSAAIPDPPDEPDFPQGSTTRYRSAQRQAKREHAPRAVSHRRALATLAVVPLVIAGALALRSQATDPPPVSVDSVASAAPDAPPISLPSDPPPDEAPEIKEEGEDHASPLDIAVGHAARGTLAVPGDTDTYVLHARRGESVFFDTTAAGRGCDEDAQLFWQLDGPDGETIFPASGFNTTLDGCTDAGPYELPADGRYTLTVYGDGDATGRYAFRLWDAEPDSR